MLLTPQDADSAPNPFPSLPGPLKRAVSSGFLNAISQLGLDSGSTPAIISDASPSPQSSAGLDGAFDFSGAQPSLDPAAAQDSMACAAVASYPVHPTLSSRKNIPHPIFTGGMFHSHSTSDDSPSPQDGSGQPGYTGTVPQLSYPSEFPDDAPESASPASFGERFMQFHSENSPYTNRYPADPRRQSEPALHGPGTYALPPRQPQQQRYFGGLGHQGSASGYSTLRSSSFSVSGWQARDDEGRPNSGTQEVSISPLDATFPSVRRPSHTSTVDDGYGPSPPGTGTSSSSGPPQHLQFQQSGPSGRNLGLDSSDAPSLPSSGPARSHDRKSNRQYSFVALPGNAMKKRPRRRYDEIERMYSCSYPSCTKSYGTLNHLNAHVQMQGHGPKRSPAEFKELRKAWRERQRLAQTPDSAPAHIQHHHAYPPLGHGHASLRRGSEPNLQARARMHAAGGYLPPMMQGPRVHHRISLGLPPQASSAAFAPPGHHLPFIPPSEDDEDAEFGNVVYPGPGQRFGSGGVPMGWQYDPNSIPETPPDSADSPFAYYSSNQGSSSLNVPPTMHHRASMPNINANVMPSNTLSPSIAQLQPSTPMYQPMPGYTPQMPHSQAASPQGAMQFSYMAYNDAATGNSQFADRASTRSGSSSIAGPSTERPRPVSGHGYSVHAQSRGSGRTGSSYESGVTQ